MDRQAEHRPLTAGIQADGDRVDGLGEPVSSAFGILAGETWLQPLSTRR